MMDCLNFIHVKRPNLYSELISFISQRRGYFNIALNSLFIAMQKRLNFEGI
jgi:hypothetical protein